MIEKFLNAKHWQIFFLLFGIPMLIQFYFVGMMFTSFRNEASPNFEIFHQFFNFFPVLMLIFAGVFFGWLWAVGIGLQGKIPVKLQLNTRRFTFFIVFPSVYLVFFAFFIMNMIQNVLGAEVIPNFNYFFWIFPFHFFSMFCMLYNLYFVAKTIKTAETHQELRFSDFAGEFFMLWLYPIGIWLLQPRINQLVEEGVGN